MEIKIITKLDFQKGHSARQNRSVKKFTKPKPEPIELYGEVDNCPDIPDLPIPRLEILWVHDDECEEYDPNWYARYDLVYMHIEGCVVRAALGHTRSSRIGVVTNGTIDIPFRNGACAAHDSATLGIPAFVRYGNFFQPIKALEK